MESEVAKLAEERALHDRWLRWKRDFPGRIFLAKRQFDYAEASVRAFGPHITDVGWLDSGKLYEDVYGGYDPIDFLLDVMHFPVHSDMVDRTVYISRVRDLMAERVCRDNGEDYMPRSIVLGWICREHDLLLSDLAEVA